MSALPQAIENFQKAFNAMNIEGLAACFSSQCLFKGTNETEYKIASTEDVKNYFAPLVEKRSMQVFELQECEDKGNGCYSLKGVFHFKNKTETAIQQKPVEIDVIMAATDDSTELFESFSSRPAPALES